MVKFLRDPTFTGGVSDPEATDIDRRAQDVVKFGKIHEVDLKKKPPSYRVLIGDENDEDNHIITDWLPASGSRAKGDRETHFLEKGEKVALLCEGGELATSYVMPAGQFTEEEDEKETTDKAGVWKKVFKGGGSISYDREKGDWNIEGLDNKGSITLKGAGCSIVMKDGTITLKGKNVKVDAEEKFESKAANSEHTGTSKVVTVGPTHIGMDSAGDSGEPIEVVPDMPAKNAFAKKA